MRRFDERFFQLPTLQLCRELLGAKLTTVSRGRVTSGMVVEIEAYHGAKDAASHAFCGKTLRNSIMFGPPGRAYVYFSYGMHYCMNVVSESEGIGAGILIRALEPLEGMAIMEGRRRTKVLYNLASGPGKLCQALGIRFTHAGENLSSSPRIRLSPYRTFRDEEVVRSPRVGISKSLELEWRFFLKDNPFVSARRPSGKR